MPGLRRKWKDHRAIARWNRAGRPAPPPHAVKQQALRAYARRFGLDVFVETGTYKGDMIAALKDDFRKLYSIELADHFFADAVARFSAEEEITILHGDSGRVLRELVPRLDGPTLFWLDGHYSAGKTARGDKDTPVMEELGHIFSRGDLRCVILVDDARCFAGEGDQEYPSLAEVRAFVAAQRPTWGVEVATDSIRITPPE